MLANLLLHAIFALVPVCLFLAALVWLDSYKLIPLPRILIVIALGAVAAALSYPINTAALDWFDLGFSSYARFVAPLLEEALKAAIIIVMVRSNRIGFLIDAAIFGFAVGAGFAILENIFFLQTSEGLGPAVWLVRGFGTAIMHGGATAIFAVVSETLAGQNPTRGYAIYLPGFVGAVIVHATFNHFFFSPVINTLLVLTLLPVLLSVIFQKSEQTVSDWLGKGFDKDTELLELINSGEFSSSKIGLYLHSMKQKFDGPVVADLLCYLRLYTELSIRAKGLLMMREAGFQDQADDETRAKFDELKYLESSVGATALLAIRPFMRMSQEDLWQFYRLSR